MHVTDTRTWQMTLDNNKPAMLTLSSRLTANDLSDMEEWFSLILRSLRRQAAVECADGFHESSTRGYGHQRCVKCGMEWEFGNVESTQADPAVDPPVGVSSDCPRATPTPSSPAGSPDTEPT